MPNACALAMAVFSLAALLPAARSAGGTARRPAVLNTEALARYVEAFNAADEELYANIPNARALEFLRSNIPLFDCPAGA